MKKIKYVFTLVCCLAIVSFIFSCKEEEPLEPNDAAALAQTSNFDGSDFFGGGNNGGGNTGGGSNVSQFFEANIDGTNTTFSSITYQSMSGLSSISGANNSSMTSISFSLFSSLNSGDTIDLGGATNGGAYTQGVGNAWSSFEGQLIVDSSTTAFLMCSFHFNAENFSTADTVRITNGSFKVAK
jgi:hypothetical protein